METQIIYETLGYLPTYSWTIIPGALAIYYLFCKIKNSDLSSFSIIDLLFIATAVIMSLGAIGLQNQANKMLKSQAEEVSRFINEDWNTKSMVLQSSKNNYKLAATKKAPNQIEETIQIELPPKGIEDLQKVSPEFKAWVEEQKQEPNTQQK